MISKYLGSLLTLVAIWPLSCAAAGGGRIWILEPDATTLLFRDGANTKFANVAWSPDQNIFRLVYGVDPTKMNLTITFVDAGDGEEQRLATAPVTALQAQVHLPGPKTLKPGNYQVKITVNGINGTWRSDVFRMI